MSRISLFVWAALHCIFLMTCPRFGLGTMADTRITVASDPTAVPALVDQGGDIKLAFNATIWLTNTLIIKTNTTIDATGYSVRLDGNGMLRHFMVTNGATLRLINLTLQHGRFAPPVSDAYPKADPGFGGSICNLGGSVELIGCNFIGNQAIGADALSNGLPRFGGDAFGGGLYSTNGQVLIINAQFINNSTVGGQGATYFATGFTGEGGHSSGGAIYLTNSSLTLLGATFHGNFAQGGQMSIGLHPLAGGGTADGGAIAAQAATIFMTNCVFIGNQALGATKIDTSIVEQGNSRGGAIFQDRGSMQIDQALFSSNLAQGVMEKAPERGLLPVTAMPRAARSSFRRAVWNCAIVR
jgi:hypothetical protein